MNRKAGVLFLFFIWILFVSVKGAVSAPVIQPEKNDNTGFLAVDCNIAGVNLYLCPKTDFVRKEVKVFFGLITSRKYVCSKGELFLGTTPLKLTRVPAGSYILLISPDYVWEKEGPIHITVLSREKTYFLLKIFSTRAHRPEDDHGGGGGGGAGGGGSR